MGKGDLTCVFVCVCVCARARARACIRACMWVFVLALCMHARALDVGHRGGGKLFAACLSEHQSSSSWSVAQCWMLHEREEGTTWKLQEVGGERALMGGGYLGLNTVFYLGSVLRCT